VSVINPILDNGDEDDKTDAFGANEDK